MPTVATDLIALGADDGTRTRNLLFTKQLLCQLSYVGKHKRSRLFAPTESIETDPLSVKLFTKFCEPKVHVRAVVKSAPSNSRDVEKTANA